jgi:hypothetical protein
LNGITSTKTCPGLCCTRFPLSTPWLKLHVWARDGGEEARQLVAMLRPDTPRRGERNETFTCRHYDRETRSCTAYDERPRMCREYPYHGPCHFCTYDPDHGVHVGVIRPEWASLAEPIFEDPPMLPPAPALLALPRPS